MRKKHTDLRTRSCVSPTLTIPVYVNCPSCMRQAAQEECDYVAYVHDQGRPLIVYTDGDYGPLFAIDYSDGNDHDDEKQKPSEVTSIASKEKNPSKVVSITSKKR